MRVLPSLLLKVRIDGAPHRLPAPTVVPRATLPIYPLAQQQHVGRLNRLQVRGAMCDLCHHALPPLGPLERFPHCTRELFAGGVVEAIEGFIENDQPRPCAESIYDH